MRLNYVVRHSIVHLLYTAFCLILLQSAVKLKGYIEAAVISSTMYSLTRCSFQPAGNSPRPRYCSTSTE